MQERATDPAFSIRRRTPTDRVVAEPRHANVSAVRTEEIPHLAAAWILDGQYRMLSRSTIRDRQGITDNLYRFLSQHKYPFCGRNELRAFFLAVREGKNNERGKPASARTVANYYKWLRPFFAWLVEEGVIDASPYAHLSAPRVPPMQIKPFTQEHIRALLAAAKGSQQPRRDVAILLLLLDTGMRASELCALRVRDLDTLNRTATITGKGGKKRDIYWHPVTGRALMQYLRKRKLREDEPVFLSAKGRTPAAPLTIWGLRQIFHRLGKEAKLVGVRCSPHTFRHTAALQFLRAGGNQLDLMRLMGHSDVAMTARYVNQASADIQQAHRRHSPVGDMLGGKG